MVRTRRTVIEKRLVAQKKHLHDLNLQVEKKEEQLTVKDRRLVVLDGIQKGSMVDGREFAVQSTRRVLAFQGQMQAARRVAMGWGDSALTLAAAE
jgi:hypothetical protein